MTVILFETNFIFTQVAMLDLLLRFDHHWRPSSGTECSLVQKQEEHLVPDLKNIKKKLTQ